MKRIAVFLIFAMLLSGLAACAPPSSEAPGTDGETSFSSQEASTMTDRTDFSESDSDFVSASENSNPSDSDLPSDPEDLLPSEFYPVTEVRSPDLSPQRKERADRFLEAYRRLAPMTEELYNAVQAAWDGSGYLHDFRIVYEYYGTYQGYAVFRNIPLDAQPHEVTLGDYTFHREAAFEFVGFRDGDFYSCTDLYDQGILRKEDVKIMWDYYQEVFRDSEVPDPVLSEDIAAEISQHSSAAHLICDGYLGTYEGYVVYAYSGVLDVLRSEYFAGCYFSGNDLHLGGYKDGKFDSVKNLYNAGKLSRQSVEQISAQYNRRPYRVRLPLLDPLPAETVAKLEQEFNEQTGRILALHEIDYYGTHDGVICFFARTDQNDDDEYSGLYGYKDGRFFPLSRKYRPPGDWYEVRKHHLANQFCEGIL